MTLIRSSLRVSALTLVAPAAFLVLTGCSNGSSADDQLRADLAAAAQAPSMRQQYVSPMEMGYPQQYPPYGQYPQYAPYPQYPQQAYYPQPVYAPAPAPQRVVVQR